VKRTGQRPLLMDAMLTLPYETHPAPAGPANFMNPMNAKKLFRGVRVPTLNPEILTGACENIVAQARGFSR